MGRIKKSNILLTCGLAFFGAAFAVGLGVAINSENNQTYEEVYAEPDHDHSDWTAWNTSNSLPDSAGYYYLTTNVTTSGGWTVPSGEVSLCLNNHIITLGGQIIVGSGCTLSLYDDGTTLRYYTGYQSNKYGKVFNDPNDDGYKAFTGNKGTFTGGYIIRSYIEKPSEAALIEVKNSGTLNMASGTLIGVGDAITMGGATINISGGNIFGAGNAIWGDSGHNMVSISGGELSCNGGNVTKNSGIITLNLSGGRFTKNFYNGINVQTLNVSGSPYVEDTNSRGGIIINFNGASVMNITGPLDQGAHMDIYVDSSENIYKFTEGWSTYMSGKNPSDYFSFTNQTNRAVDLEDGEAVAKKTYTITYDSNGATSGTVPTNGTCVHGSSTPAASNTGNLQKTGLFFNGWNTKSDPNAEGAVHYSVGDPIAVTANTTLYVEWTDHIHDWSYALNGTSTDSIKATCIGTIGTCTETTGLTLTMSAPTSLTYDGTAKPVTFNADHNVAAFGATPTPTYYSYYDEEWHALTEAPTNVGTYKAEVTYGGETASVEYEVVKSNPTYTAPTPIDLTYTGSAQELVNAGTTADGTIQYKLGDGDYSTSIPTATDAGTYNVYYQIIGDANHSNLVIAEPIQVTIARADVTLTAPTGIISAHDGESHALITAGSVTGGELQYKVGDGDWSTTIPTATDIGDYNVYYKVVGDANHNDVAETAVSPTPAINESVATVSDGTTTSYYYDFATAVSNWNDGTTLTLYKDVTTASTITVDNTRILDLNGYGIRATGNNYRIFYITSAGNLTVDDSTPTRVHTITLSNYRGIKINVDDPTEVVNGTGVAFVEGGYITGGYSTSSSVKEGIAFYVNGGKLDLYGGTIIGNYVNVTYCSGAGVYVTNGGRLRMYDGTTFIYNYAQNSSSTIENAGSTFEMYGGTISYNKNDWGSGVAVSNTGACTFKLYGGTIEHNTNHSTGPAVALATWDSNPNQYFGLSGSPVVLNNQPKDLTRDNDVLLYTKINIEGTLTNTAKLGITLDNNGAGNIWTNGTGVFTTGWSTYMAGEDPADYFFSDNPAYIIYLKDGEACCGVPYTVTYNANGHGTAPEAMTVGDGALVNEPTAPTAQDWDFGGWYKEDTCETLWDFASDTVTADTTLYAGWKNSYEITAPTAITGLKYKGSNQELINAGSTPAGEMQYAVNTTGVLPDDGDFANTIPTGKLVNKYYVFYRTTGDADHYPVPASLETVIEVNIARVDRTKVTTLNDEVIEFLDSIKDDDRLDSVRTALEGVRNEVYNDAIVEDNIDEAGVEENYLKLKEAFDYHKQTANAVKLIDDIGELTYDGGIDDSQDDIIKAQSAYDALKPEQQEVVKNANKDVLDHDILVYKHVDKVGDLIKAIPEPSDSDEYYDAIDLAKAEFDKLTDEEKAVLNTDTKFDYEKALNDHRKAKEVIKTISKMDDVTYNGGTDDSLDEIKNAEEAYNGLTPDQKKIVDQANHDELEDKRESYDKVDDTVKKINNIGDIAHGGEKDSKKDIDDARKAYDSLSEEEKALVGGYNNSTQTLEDGEAVYEVMELIDSIGDIAYDTVPEKAIEEARQTYQSLTEVQKEKLGKEYYEVLVKSEEQYEEAKKTGDILLLVLMIILGLLLIAGLIFMFILLKKKKDDDDDNKKEPLKVASFSGLLPIIFLSHYLDAPYIILYVIAALTVIVWTADIIIAVKKKGQKKAKAVTAQEVRKVEESQPTSEEEEEVVTVTDEKGNIFQIRFIKSFTAKLIQSPDETKKYYEELKNEVLSYKKTNSRVSWHYDSVNSGRNQVLKFAIRGKTLCVYYPLNADDYADTKYKVEKSESKKYEEVPCMYRIKNERRLGYAKDLIAVVASNLGLVKGEEQHEVYSNLPYEPNKPLIARGLIKEQKIQVNKPVEQPVSEPVNEDEDEVITLADEKGNIFQIRFVKSFTAKLIQSPDETKKYYEELKNYVLSYKKTTSRISWNYDSINSGRNQVLKFSIRGKTLCVYYPLNADDYAESKYKVEKVESKKFEEVPCLYRIKNDRRRDYAKDLIDTVMANLGLEKGEEQHEVYSNLPYEPNKPLIARGLIKELKVQMNKPTEPQVLETKTNADGDEVVITKDASGNIFEIRYIKSFTAKLSQSDDEVKDYYSELKNYALSYKKANSRVSWHYDSINVGRNQVLKFAIRGKTLCLYYALDADQYIDTKYKVEKVESKKFEDVPCLYRIKNDRRRDYAKDLIDTVMANVGASKGEEQNEDYRIPYEETKVLLGKGLIKEVKTKVNKPEEVVLESVSVTEVDQKMSDEVAEAKIIEDTTSKKHEGKKGIINIDTIGDNFSNGDVVDIEALWKKKLIPSNVGYVKVLARGSLNKRLTVDLQDYSIQAVKMILLAGGNVKKAK